MRVSNQRGNIALALMILVAITVLEIYYFFATHSRDATTIQRRYLVQGSVKEILAVADNALNSPKAFINTVSGPLNNSGSASLSRCMSDPTYDCPAGTFPLTIYLDDPTIVFSNPSVADAGTDFGLNACTGYSNPMDMNCVLKLNATWTPTCAASPCILPSINVDAVVALKATFLDKMVLNTTSFNFTKRIR